MRMSTGAWIIWTTVASFAIFPVHTAKCQICTSNPGTNMCNGRDDYGESQECNNGVNELCTCIITSTKDLSTGKEVTIYNRMCLFSLPSPGCLSNNGTRNGKAVHHETCSCQGDNCNACEMPRQETLECQVCKGQSNRCKSVDDLGATEQCRPGARSCLFEREERTNKVTGERAVSVSRRCSMVLLQEDACYNRTEEKDDWLAKTRSCSCISDGCNNQAASASASRWLATADQLIFLVVLPVFVSQNI